MAALVAMALVVATRVVSVTVLVAAVAQLRRCNEFNDVAEGCPIEVASPAPVTQAASLAALVAAPTPTAVS